MARDLRSTDAKVRLEALARLGLDDQHAHRDVWSQSSPSNVTGTKVIAPDQVRLTYAPLGEAATMEAILAIEIDQLQEMYVVVMEPSTGGWQRVAQADCWCKYDMASASDALSSFVQLAPAPGGGLDSPHPFELVVHASGGGSGLYMQTEARFRMRGGELREMLSFTSRRLSCPGLSCTLERRWFNWAVLAGEGSGTLVEARGTFPSDTRHQLLLAERDLETRSLQRISCTSMVWDQQSFRYQRVKNSTHPCLTAAP